MSSPLPWRMAQPYNDHRQDWAGRAAGWNIRKLCEFVPYLFFTYSLTTFSALPSLSQTERSEITPRQPPQKWQIANCSEQRCPPTMDVQYQEKQYLYMWLGLFRGSCNPKAKTADDVIWWLSGLSLYDEWWKGEGYERESSKKGRNWMGESSAFSLLDVDRREKLLSLLSPSFAHCLPSALVTRVLLSIKEWIFYLFSEKYCSLQLDV